MCIGTDQGKNKSFEHNMQQYIQICFMVELESFLIVNMSRSFLPPVQKCALLGVGSIPDPLSHTGRAILISLSFILPILESLLIESTLLKLQVVSFKLIKEGLQKKH